MPCAFSARAIRAFLFHALRVIADHFKVVRARQRHQHRKHGILPRSDRADHRIVE